MMGLQTLAQGLFLLNVVTLGVSGLSYSQRMAWLRSDRTRPYIGSEFDEGDTTICYCEITIHVGPPLESLEFLKKPFGRDDLVTIARGERIVYNDGKAKFSDVNITVVNENTTEYRITLSNIDRYDSGNAYFCKTIWPDRDGAFSKDLKIRWSRPEPQCSSDITDKAKKGDRATYQCVAADTDGRSTGTLSMLRGDTRLDASLVSTNLDVGKQFNSSYSTTITDDSLKDVYSCRYIGTGGFQEYDYDCTFDMPTCVVDDLNDQCSGIDSASGALPSRGHLQITTEFLVLVFFYIAFN